MKDDDVELALSATLLSRLLREGAIVASDFRCLNRASDEATRVAIKESLKRRR
ncbi:hypothetical protein GCM10007052_21740 [Halioglobus japonicus]|uniref:hypothetical protein n=1 Tax=Halioglobus TaxID=1217416 RepID=UPI0012E96301|nr:MULTISPECIES: hypothetical protein [Halioglobus]GHD16380.1 hypothetical protein GCM10007052_21740 [Halioglobus japonicus]